MNELNIALEHIYDDLKYKENINIIEVGTGYGNNSTCVLYNYFKNKGKKFNLHSYEGLKKCFIKASEIWSKIGNVKIFNEYFCNKEDIQKLLIPNIPSYIVDYKEDNKRLVSKYLNLKLEGNITNSINLLPDIIFIDCSRFMHLTIINKCYDLMKGNLDCYFIMEEDYFYEGNYGELNIIQKYFKLKNVEKIKNSTWQWPFIIFKINYKL